MHRRKRKILKSLVLGFAVAAFAAPTALAEPRGPGNPGEPVITGTSSDDRSVARGTSAHLEQRMVSSDDRAVFRGTPTNKSENVVVRAIVSPDDRALFRGIEARTVPVSLTVSSSSDGFQWADAGLGAASTLAFVLLLGSATFLIRNQRRRLAAF